MYNRWIVMVVFVVLIQLLLTDWIMPAQAADPFEVVEAVLCERVEERECVAPKKEKKIYSAKEGQICLFTRIRTEADVDTFHIWYHRDRLREQNISESEIVERFLEAFRGVGGESEKTIFKLSKLENVTFGIKLSTRPSPGYRTWSCKTIVPSLHQGKWAVKIMDSSGKVYKTLEFEVG